MTGRGGRTLDDLAEDTPVLSVTNPLGRRLLSTYEAREDAIFACLLLGR